MKNHQHHRIIELLLFLMNIHPIVTTEADDDKNLLKILFYPFLLTCTESIYTFATMTRLWNMIWMNNSGERVSRAEM